MRGEIEWGDPPPSLMGGRHGEVKQFVAVLRTRPGEWAKYPNSVKSQSLSTKNTLRFPGTDWTTRARPDGRFDVYGRWVGDTTTGSAHSDEINSNQG